MSIGYVCKPSWYSRSKNLLQKHKREKEGKVHHYGKPSFDKDNKKWMKGARELQQPENDY